MTFSIASLHGVICRYLMYYAPLKLKSPNVLFLSGDLVADTPMKLSGQRGHVVGFSLTVILVVFGAICLGAFFIFRRHRKKNRTEMLIQPTEEDLEADSTKAGCYQIHVCMQQNIYAALLYRL